MYALFHIYENIRGFWRKIKTPFIVLGIVAVVGLVLRLVNVNAFTVNGDGAHYAYRALGWFDYMGSLSQTTPIQWFTTAPGWSFLSFRDAPPLVFLIQHLFFGVFGNSTAVLRLPGILSALAVAVLVFFVVKKYHGEVAGYVSALVMSISSFAVWNSLSGNLEAVEILFITLTLLTFLKFVEKPHLSRWLYAFAFTLALSILCKYTAIFLIPATGLFLVLWQKPILKDLFATKTGWRKVVVSLVLFLVVLSPIIVYNIKSFATRGHFDAALSSMVGMHPQDFGLISSRGASFDPGTFVDIAVNLFNSNSVGFLTLAVLSMLFVLYRVVRKQASDLEKILLTSFGFMFLMFAFAGSAERWLVIVMPLWAMSVAILAREVVLMSRGKIGEIGSVIIVGIFSLVFLAEGFYSVNTNVLAVPVLRAPWFYASNRFYDDGMANLEKYLREHILSDTKYLGRPDKVKDISALPVELVKGRNIVIYDDRTKWFPFMWYFNKYRTYSRYPFISLYTFLDNSTETLKNFREAGAGDFYIIYITPEGPHDVVFGNQKKYEANFERFLPAFEKVAEPAVDIKDARGVVVFRIFKIPPKLNFTHN